MNGANKAGHEQETRLLVHLHVPGCFAATKSRPLMYGWCDPVSRNHFWPSSILRKTNRFLNQLLQVRYCAPRREDFGHASTSAITMEGAHKIQNMLFKMLPLTEEGGRGVCVRMGGCDSAQYYHLILTSNFKNQRSCEWCQQSRARVGSPFGLPERYQLRLATTTV